jgi:hypothetical protein
MGVANSEAHPAHPLQPNICAFTSHAIYIAWRSVDLAALSYASLRPPPAYTQQSVAACERVEHQQFFSRLCSAVSSASAPDPACQPGQSHSA